MAFKLAIALALVILGADSVAHAAKWGRQLQSRRTAQINSILEAR